MISGPEKNSRLANLRVLPQNFPFYGKIELKKFKELNSEVSERLSKEKVVLLYPELLEQLKLKIGDKVQIGESFFTILDVVTHDSTTTMDSFSLFLKNAKIVF